MADEHDNNNPDDPDRHGHDRDDSDSDGSDSQEAAIADTGADGDELGDAHESISSTVTDDSTGPGASGDTDLASEPEAFDEDTDTDAPCDEPTSGYLNVQRDQTRQNRAVLGRLVLHYPVRTIALVLDGDAALRCLAVLSHQGHRGYLDRIVPASSTALAGWVMVESDGLLAAEWIPGLDAPEPSRVTVDPVAA